MLSENTYPLMFWGDVASLGTAIAWSLATICFRMAAHRYDSLTLNLLKNLLALTFFAISFFVLKEPLVPQWPAKTWFIIVVSGILGIAIGDVLFVAALRRIGASLQAIVDCLYAPIIIAIATLHYSDKLSGSEIVGAGLIVSSILIAFTPWPLSKTRKRAFSAPFAWGLIYGISAQVFIAIAVFMVRDLLQDQLVLRVTAYRFFFGTIALLPFWLQRARNYTRTPLPNHKEGHRTWKWLLLGSFVGPFLATWLWLLGFKWTTASRSALLNQLSTVITVLLAGLILKESITRRKMIAVTVAILGALLL